MKRLLGSTLALVGLLTLSATLPAQAQQTTLDFENLSNPSGTGGFNSYGGSVSQNGFTITDSFGGISANAPDGAAFGFNYTGSTALTSNFGGDTFFLTQNNGNAFTLNQVDIANFFLNSGGATVNFTGNLFGGGTVNQTFNVVGGNALQTFTFNSNFTNLTSVSFVEGSGDVQYDNFVINATPVPEPAFVAMSSLLALGSGGLLLRRRKSFAQRVD